MHHDLYRVTAFEIIGDYLLRVRFDDDAEQVINLARVLYGEVWGPLRKLDFFNQVSIDPIAHTLTWPNGADFDPETLRHWDEYKDELAERANNLDSTEQKE